MKKLVNMFVLFSIMLFPSLVNAYELNCGTGPYSFNDSFVCTISGDNSINYDVMKGTLENTDTVSCIMSSIADGMHSNMNDEVTNKFDIAGRSPSRDLVSFKCQVIAKPDGDKSVQLFINDFTYHNSTSQETNQTEILRSNAFTIKKYDEQATKPVDTKPRDTTNSNSRLRGISSEGLDFTFSSFITEYNIDVLYEVDELDLKVFPFNLDATYRIVGSQKLEIGDNTIDIYVTSPDGKSTTCYTLYVRRLPRGEEIYYPEEDASLKDLIISGQNNLKFEKDTLQYTINIGYDVDTIDINAVPTVDGAKVNINNATGLKNGDVITINVESSDGSISRKYLITIRKAAPPYDYSKILILGAVGVGFLVLIVLVIYSSRKSKEDPLLKLKNDKRKVNKGENFDPNAVPEATSSVNGAPSAPNVIKADTVSVVSPMMVDPNMVDDNRNKISSNVNTLDLNSTALPTQLPVGVNQNINQPAVNNVVNNNLNNNAIDTVEEQAAPVNTLDLSGAAAPMSDAPVNAFNTNPVAPVQLVPSQPSVAQPTQVPTTPTPPVTSLDQVSSVAIPVPPNNNQNN